MASNYPPRTVWGELSSAERAAVTILAEPMSRFESAVSVVYNAGVRMPTLPARRHGARDLDLAALYLSRALADLRALWLLLSGGYSAPAATIAAALFEHALACACIAGQEKRADRVVATPEKLPWDVASLCKMFTRDLGRAAARSGSLPPPFEQHWRLLYGEYLWLCRIKHPTVEATAYQAGATELPDGTYAVGGAPDVRDADLVVKAVIVHISVGATLYAVNLFGQAAVVEDTAEFREVARQLGTVDSTLKAAIATIPDGPLPFHLGGTKLASEYNNLRTEP